MNFDYTLYLVTDRQLMSCDSLTEAVEQAILGGCTMIQLREKELSSLEFYNQAVAVKQVTDKYHIPLIINDRIDIAMAVQATGVHIGQHDLPAAAVRKVIGENMLLGVSASSIAEAIQAQQDGADYLGVGAMFPTGTKTDADSVSMEELQKIRAAVSLPIVVIGGINKGNAGRFKPMGIDGLAVVSAIIAQSDIKAAAAELKDLFCGKEKKMDFNAAIFDLDGTILDSMDVWEHIDIQFLKKRNLPVPENYVTEICARSFEEAAQYTIDLFGLQETVEGIIEEWNNMAVEEYSNHVGLLPYALDYLLCLKEHGIKLAVATGLPEKLYMPCLKNNSILELFDALCSTDEVQRGKEYSDVFELAARKLGVAPEHCIVFDDVLPAIKSAKAASMLAGGIYDKYSADQRAEIERIADIYLLNFRQAPIPHKEA